MNVLRVAFGVFVIFTFIPSLVLANGADEAYVTLVETFGLATEKQNGKYRVITFIPRTFLLFDIDKKEPDLRVGEQYLAATTQDGVRVYVLERAVSSGPFKTVYGEQDIIFNKSHSVCFNVSCDQQDDDQLLQINAGEVFKTEKQSFGDSEVYKIVGNRGNRNSIDEVTGYISKVELDKLNHKSIITFATLRHPRYRLTSYDARSINTTCGERINSGDRKNNGSLTDTEKRVISAFGIADIGANNNLQFKRGYGGKGEEVVYKLYDVIDRRVEPNVQEIYAVQIIYRCDESDILSKKTSIGSVSILNTTTNASMTFKPEGTPEDLLEFTGAPYLYSVNSSRQYFQIMDKLSEKFESRALAGYFLAGFNRSCSGQYRKQEKSCQHSAYEQNSNN